MMNRAQLLAFCVATLLAEAALADEAAVPLFDGLGSRGRVVTTDSPEAQRYFSQGLSFLYAFNHDEAIRSFQKAAALDPECAMAWWGIAVANGPHINNPVVPLERAKAAWEALGKAREAVAKGTTIEKALIEALASRYAAEQPEDRKPLDEAYAAAMRKVWKAHPTDADVGALFAESMMDLRPWDLWLPTGEPQPGSEEIVATIESVLTQDPNHPLGLHLYIHAVEASPHPERAVAPADRLRDLQPGLGHLVHMPSHIDVRTGNWAKAIEANAKAIEADRRYREQSPKQNFYRIYMAHNRHMLAFAAMMRGQSKLATESIASMVREMPAEWVKENAIMADGFQAMPLEVLVRFGRWDEVLAAPAPPEYLPISRALRHAARGIAFAAKGDVESARKEQIAFLAARKLVAEEAIVGNNKGHDVLKVAEHLLAGEILVREGEADTGIAQLREAVKCEDGLRYSEPPDWIHPVRHALGANLLALGRAADAEQVYRESLSRLPNDGWSYYGLARSLRLQERADEAAPFETEFAAVWRDADVKITSSCFCQPGK
jgi:tetratricopeptide (TPR) repeat protein